MPDLIISTPKRPTEEGISYGASEDETIGYYEVQGKRPSQEDSLVMGPLDPKTLIPTDSMTPLSPQEIGHRLWTTYQILDKNVCNNRACDGGGTTATTTVHDGNGNLITATLGDAVAFAAIYDKENNLLGVMRLNEVTHKPVGDEKTRIEQVELPPGLEMGRRVSKGRVVGRLAVSRSIGDKGYKPLVCSEARIDVTSTHEIASQFPEDTIGKIQIISTCDGFTDGAGEKNQTKSDHENYLLKILNDYEEPGKYNAGTVANTLCSEALADDSQDNITVCVQEVRPNVPFLQGVYDGHSDSFGVNKTSGADVSAYVATEVSKTLIEQCTMRKEDYMVQALSVNAHSKVFNRDNPQLQAVNALGTETQRAREEMHQLRSSEDDLPGISPAKDSPETPSR